MELNDVKVGMRVNYRGTDGDTDSGVVTGLNAYDNPESVWVEWDSDGKELHVNCYYLQPENIEPSYTLDSAIKFLTEQGFKVTFEKV